MYAKNLSRVDRASVQTLIQSSINAQLFRYIWSPLKTNFKYKKQPRQNFLVYILMSFSSKIVIDFFL